jgi:hypothetical protein
MNYNPNSNAVPSEQLLDKLADDMMGIWDVMVRSTKLMRATTPTKEQMLGYVEGKNKIRAAYSAFCKLLLKVDNKLASKYFNTKAEYYQAMMDYEEAIDDILPLIKFSSTCIQADALLKGYLQQAGKRALKHVGAFLRKPRLSVYGGAGALTGGLAYGHYRQRRQHAPTVNQMTDYDSGVKPHTLNRHNRSFE